MATTINNSYSGVFLNNAQVETTSGLFTTALTGGQRLTAEGGSEDRTSLLDGCELEIKVEAVECFASSPNNFLKTADQNNPSLTLNSVVSSDTGEIAGSSVVLASGSLESNINYFSNFVRLQPAGTWSYNILKVSYKSPCNLAALSFKLDIPSVYAVSPIGVYSTSEGVVTGAAYDKMTSITALSFDGNPVPATSTNFCFFQKDEGSFCPASEDWSVFCYILTVVSNNSGKTQVDLCLSGNQNVSDIKGYKNEFVQTSIDLSQTELYINIAQAAGGTLNPQIWSQYLGYQALMAINLLTMPYEQSDAQRQLAIANIDYDLNGEIDVADTLSIFRLIWAVSRGETLNVDELPNNVPKSCCGGVEQDIPSGDRSFNCDADIEIVNVQCSGPYVQKSASYAQTHATAGSMIATTGDSSTSSLGDPCDENSDDTDAGVGSMIVDIRIKNTATVSGFQFDIGFNKFSTASDNHISVQTNPTLISKGWQTAHKTCDDRFGYDKLVRVVSFQGLGDNHFPNGYNVLDNEWYSYAHQIDSIQPNSRGEGFGVVRLIIANAPKTTCACPSKSYYISRPLSSIKSLNQDQISNPELYEVGTEWKGPVVYSQGIWWTASLLGGQPVWDGSSIPLLVEWSGIKLLNKRVVTNQDLAMPEHEKYGATYYGHYSGFLAEIPQSYEDYISFYRSQIGNYVIKALHNGLDIGYDREISTYDYIWQISYFSLIRFIERYRSDTGLDPLTEDAKRAVLSTFIEKDYKGFVDDANLDGKFDVADIVSLYNSARMRYYGLNNKNESGWRAAPTDEWTWVLNSSQHSKDIYSTYSHPTSVAYSFPDKPSFSDFPNFQKIVPAYCQNTICTSTMSDICPDICGNMDYETEETLKNNADAFSLIGFGERTDIKPNTYAKLELIFSEQPNDNSFITLQDYSGIKNTFVFVANGTATTGDILVGGEIAVEKQLSLRGTIIEFSNAVDGVNNFGIVTGSLSEEDNSTVLISFLQRVDGEVGNTPVIYSEDIYSSLIRYTNRFVDGQNYYSTLPNTFRGWHEYFYDIYNLQAGDLYRNEVRYGSNGASFIPLELRVTSKNKKLTEVMSYISWSWTTLDFCDAYLDIEASEPKVKVLPGNGFTMCEVFDAITGARMTPITAAEYNNFYQVPFHGKISILSHNFKTVGGVEEYGEAATLENSDKFAPITMDGGKLITAKMFVSPMPNWSDGRSIKILNNHNDALNESMGVFSSSYAPIARSKEIANTTNGTLAIGPKTSEYSQNYAQDSASLMTDAEYTLHAQILNPRTVLVKYNTMRPFSYASFSIRAHKGSSEIESVSAPQGGLYGGYKGWQFSHHFHENQQTNIDGLPLLPKNYATDGYSVVTVSPVGETVAPDKTIYGTSNPYNFSGMGDLCIIKFKQDICGQLPIFGKQYICPPIGKKNVVYPQKNIDTTTDNTSRPIDNKYPEGSFESEKYSKTTSSSYENKILSNYDSANNQDGKMVLGEGNTLQTWHSYPYGADLKPYLEQESSAPVYSSDDGDARNSLYFDRTKGLSIPNGSLVDSVAITRWSTYCAFKPTDIDIHSTVPMTLFVAGDTIQTDPDNAPKLCLKITRTDPAEYTITARAEDGVSGLFSELTYVMPSDDLSGWHIFSWTGDFNTSTSHLYLDGELIDSDEVMTGLVPNNNPKPLDIHLGYNGEETHAQIDAHSEPFQGRIGQFMLFGEQHASDLRQKAEAFLALKYGIQENLPVGHIGYKDEQTGSGLSDAGYLSLNKTDNLTATSRLMAQGGGDLRIEDLGSDRCAAAWVSKHICLDKDNQTLIAKKCGSNDGFVQQFGGGGGGGQIGLGP